MSRVVDLLISATGLREADVRRLVDRAPRTYKVYYIPKKNGGKRRIAQPAKQTKFLQRAFMSAVLEALPIHQCATAYRRGLSIRDNAKPHSGDGAILKMDFRNFFPSIRGLDWITYCREHGVFESPEDLYLSERLLFYRDKSSPSLRRLNLLWFQNRLSHKCTTDCSENLPESILSQSGNQRRQNDRRHDEV